MSKTARFPPLNTRSKSQSNMNTSTKDRPSVPLAGVYRQVRYAAYRALAPADAAFRKANRMGHYPPIHLRRHAGLLGSLQGSGPEFVAYLKLLMDLRAEHRIWDVGCGCALLELALETAGWRGALVGTDIHAPSIRWAEKTIASRVPAFTFIHADIHNTAYWPNGKLSAEKWLADFEETGFDIIVAKSLFTHMMPHELGTYFDALGRKLTPTGKALLTFFLLDERPGDGLGKADIAFMFPESDAVYAVKRLAAPTASVAYRKKHVLDCLDKAGLQLLSQHRGSWTGHQDTLSYQDMLVVGKK